MAKRSLLLVDGDVRSLRVLEVSLKKAGFNVTTAVNGKDALEKVRTATPDLIISDTEMIGMTGFEFCRKLKEHPEWKHLPFIFLTGKVGIEHKIRGLELGVEDYLTKPIYIKEILTRVRILLQKKDRDDLQEKRGAHTRFSGTLADMGVVDLIQTIEVSRKTGLIHFTANEDRSATVFFREGKVIDAECGHLQGEDAVYRLLTWTEGSFEVLFRPVRRKDALSMSSQGLLMEGMRRLDEYGRLLEQLPPLDTRFTVDYDELWDRLADLPDELNAILRLFDGRRTVMEVIDRSGYDDLKCLEIVSKLHFEGVIAEPGGRREVRSGPSRRDSVEADLMLESWMAASTTASGSNPLSEFEAREAAAESGPVKAADDSASGSAQMSHESADAAIGEFRRGTPTKRYPKGSQGDSRDPLDALAPAPSETGSEGGSETSGSPPEPDRLNGKGAAGALPDVRDEVEMLSLRGREHEGLASEDPTEGGGVAQRAEHVDPVEAAIAEAVPAELEEENGGSGEPLASEAAPAPESAVEPAPESAVEPAPESAVESASETTTTAAPAPESATAPESAAAVEPAPESAVESAPESAPAAEFDSDSESAPAIGLESDSEPAPESAPATESAADASTESESATESESGFKAEIEPASEVGGAAGGAEGGVAIGAIKLKVRAATAGREAERDAEAAEAVGEELEDASEASAVPEVIQDEEPSVPSGPSRRESHPTLRGVAVVGKEQNEEDEISGEFEAPPPPRPGASERSARIISSHGAEVASVSGEVAAPDKSEETEPARQLLTIRPRREAEESLVSVSDTEALEPGEEERDRREDENARADEELEEPQEPTLDEVSTPVEVVVPEDEPARESAGPHREPQSSAGGRRAALFAGAALIGVALLYAAIVSSQGGDTGASASAADAGQSHAALVTEPSRDAAAPRTTLADAASEPRNEAADAASSPEQSPAPDPDRNPTELVEDSPVEEEDEKDRRLEADAGAASEPTFADHYAAARQALRRGRADEALGLIEQALSLQENGKGLVLKAQILQELGHKSAALEAAEAALALGDRSPRAWLTKGLLHYELKQYTEAREALSRYLELRPTGSDADEVRVILDSL